MARTGARDVGGGREGGARETYSRLAAKQSAHHGSLAMGYVLNPGRVVVAHRACGEAVHGQAERLRRSYI